jgi:hypothetical protein
MALSPDQFPSTFYHGSKAPDMKVGSFIVPAPPTRDRFHETWATDNPDAAREEASKNSLNKHLDSPVRIWEVKPMRGGQDLYGPTSSERHPTARNYASRHGWRVVREHLDQGGAQ